MHARIVTADGPEAIRQVVCGAIHYEIDADPIAMLNCRCSDCRKASGSGYSAIIFVPKDAVKLRGDARFYGTRGSSGKMVERGFCPNCGSPVIEQVERLPNTLGILAGCLNDPSLYKPSMDLYTDSAQHWDSMLPHTKKFPKGRST
jgi:hypothetical protein